MNSKVHIVTTCTPISPYKECWEEQMDSWVPAMEKCGVPVHTVMANSNVTSPYVEVDKFIYCPGEFTFKEHYNTTASYWMNAILHWSLDHNLDYVFIVDNDTYVHPHRFISLIQEYKTNPSIMYAGACFPFWGGEGWWLHDNFQTFVDNNNFDEVIKGWASGGSGIVLSKQAIKIAAAHFWDEVEACEIKDQGKNDFILQKVLTKHNIKLYHDSRFCWESPYTTHPAYKLHPSDKVPLITNPDSFLVAQHDMSGHMKS